MAMLAKMMYCENLGPLPLKWTYTLLRTGLLGIRLELPIPSPPHLNGPQIIRRKRRPDKKGTTKRDRKKSSYPPLPVFCLTHITECSLRANSYYTPHCGVKIPSAGGRPAVPTKPSVALSGPQWPRCAPQWPTTASEGPIKGLHAPMRLALQLILWRSAAILMCCMRRMNPGPSGSGSGQQPSIHPSIHPPIYLLRTLFFDP